MKRGLPQRIPINLYLNFNEYLNLYKKVELDNIDPDDGEAVNTWIKEMLGVAA